VILIDTSGLLAALFSDQNHHEACARALREAKPPRILSPFVLAELDYLILKYAGVEAEAALIDEVSRGVYDVRDFVDQRGLGYAEIERLLHRHADLRIGLADASLIILADRYDTKDVLTLDLRHFRAIRPITRKNFRILPFDAPEEPLRTVPAPGRSRRPRATRR